MPRKLRYFPSRRSLGSRVESAALEYLSERRYLLIARNVTYRVGEIDLVLLSPEGELVFVEVRRRGLGSIERAEDAFPFAKRRKLRLAIETYLAKLPLTERRRFRGVRVDFLATDGERWIWFKGVEM